MQNIHPYIVHFPIALLSLGLVAELVGLWSDRPGARRLGGSLLVLGFVGLALAGASGWLGHRTVAHADNVHDLVERHERAGFLALALFGLLLLWRRRGPAPSAGQRVAYSLLALWGGLSLLYGARAGGELVYEHGIGTALTRNLGSPLDNPAHEHGEAEGHEEAMAPGQIILNLTGDRAGEPCERVDGNQLVGACTAQDLVRLVPELRLGAVELAFPETGDSGWLPPAASAPVLATVAAAGHDEATPHGHDTEAPHGHDEATHTPGAP